MRACSSAKLLFHSRLLFLEINTSISEHDFTPLSLHSAGVFLRIGSVSAFVELIMCSHRNASFQLNDGTLHYAEVSPSLSAPERRIADV